MHVIIIGAGAAGLMAAHLLTQKGILVTVLEARSRLGGRIHTVEPDEFGMRAEAGAEFIHGNLPVTLELMQKAGLEKKALAGEMWQFMDGNWCLENEFSRYAEEVVDKLKSLNEDITIAEFLKRYFNDSKYAGLRNSLTSYIEGYYAGTILRASSKSFLAEWLSEDDEQFRPPNGYSQLISSLANTSTSAGAKILSSTPVKQIRWSNGVAEIIDSHQKSYIGEKVIITVPLGVLGSEDTESSITFSPSIPAKLQAVQQLGFGSAIKILIKFNDHFIQRFLLKGRHADIAKLHIVISNLPIPTWWTQYPSYSPLLTGWIAGPAADEMKNLSDEWILNQGLNSLETIFQVKKHELWGNLLSYKICNWCADPFSHGSYSYSTLQTSAARKVLLKPVEDTLYFAGEALYEGTEMGTVEAALISGSKAAEDITGKTKTALKGYK